MIRYLLILLLCCSMAFADTVNEVVATSTDDSGTLAGTPSAVASATLSLTSGTCIVGNQFTALRHGAFRFQTVAIPIGSTIDTIRFTFKAGGNGGTNTCNLRWVMEDTGDATTFTDTADYNARSLTTATADWNDVPDWSTGTTYTFPSTGAASTTLADVLQEVVDRADWASGNDVVFFIYENAGSTNANRTIATEDNTSYDPPSVDIWFTSPSGIPGYYHGVAGVGVRHSPAGNSVLHKK